eukprot:TRINITY_DN22179_c0_g8_i2.p1 TRINITY_DN22179_c0_g8~~TRINITY_DN22179_c0_g8_i2.p1  ORF type:complete len:705 (+),score=118.46 TRINITY_DN22179_c0_g8_i2:280-2394(+)
MGVLTAFSDIGFNLGSPLLGSEVSRSSRFSSGCSDDVPVSPSVKPVQPLTHQLPEWVMWSITLLTATAMACINLAEILAIENATLWKFSCMSMIIANFGLVAGALALILMCMGFALIGVCMIELYAKNCGGSGLPENKCFLNGSNLPGFFTVRTLIVRVSTNVLANIAGYPVGREGPSVVIGSNVAYLISTRLLIASRHVEQWVDGGKDAVVMILDEDRIAHATRIACAVGGACGIAMIFNCPIGGLLYMFEEVTSVSWPWELTFRAFVATTLCTLLTHSLLRCCGTDVRDFVIWSWEPRQDSWGWVDIPWFVMLAAAIGVVTSFHTRGCLWVTALRRRFCSTKTSARILETIMYCGLCAALCFVASLFADCDARHPAYGSWVQLNCEAFQYNPVATLLVNTSHSSVKLLFAADNDADAFGYVATAVAFVVYSLLNICLSGLPVPGGAFTATMLMGALFGRSVGCFIALKAPAEFQTAHPSIYSVVGCAAMLCGFKQMTATVVIICIQCVQNLDVAPIVMLSVSVSMAVNRIINEHGHDEMQIKSKKLPFLDAEVPAHLSKQTAADLCSEDVVRLQRCDTVENSKLALKSQATDFPVLEDEKCVGVISREHLQAAVQARHEAFSTPFSSAHDLMQIADPHFVPVFRFMDAMPFHLEESMLVDRFWKLFSKGGEVVACVKAETGDFLGLVTRKGLLDASYSSKSH